MTKRWHRHLAPLGVPTLVIADDPTLLETASAALADWTAEAPGTAPAIELRLERADAPAGVSEGIHVDGSRLTLTDRGIEGGADARRGHGWCRVPPSRLADRAEIADAVETVLLFLLARIGRPPLHAAGVMIGDAAVLLAGPSGSGKSTLALAGAAQGLPVLSDDTVHLQLEPRFAVWSWSRLAHVFVDEAPPGDHAVRVRGGKRKAAVALPPAGVRRAERSIVVLLERGPRLSLDPVAVDEAIAALMRLDAGFDLLRAESERAIRAAVAGGTWRLTLTDDPTAAITLLRNRLH